MAEARKRSSSRGSSRSRSEQRESKQVHLQDCEHLIREEWVNLPGGFTKTGSNGKPKRETGKTVLYGTVTPGMLYDAKTDHVFMDKILWHDMVLRNASIESTRSEWSVQHDFYDRASLFDLSASLKLSFMAGLVQVTRIKYI